MISQKMQRYINAAASGDALLYLLEVTHENLVGVGYCVANTEDVIHQGRRYQAVAFNLIEPGADGKWKLSLDVVDPAIRREIHGAQGPLRVNIKQVFASDPDVIELDISDILIMRDVTWDDFTLTGTLEPDSVWAQIVPGDSYSPDTTPGIFG